MSAVPVLPPTGSGIELIWTCYEKELGIFVARTLTGLHRESRVGSLEAAEALAQALFPEGYYMRPVENHEEIWLATSYHRYPIEERQAA